MKEELIAFCGMNCRLCYAYQRQKNQCPGCRSEKEELPNSCQRCFIRNCCIENNYHFCFECNKYPCAKLKQLDKRYRTKYNMSMFVNLDEIKKAGINKFLQIEEKQWKCANCGNIICVHHKTCQKCDVKDNK